MSQQGTKGADRRPAQIWLRMLDHYGVRQAVLDRQEDRHLVAFLESQAGWVCEYQDESAVLFVRASEAENHESVPRVLLSVT